MMIFIIKSLLQYFRKKCGHRSTYSFRSRSISLTNLVTNQEENIYVITGTEAEDPLSREITVGSINDHNIDGQEEDIRKEIT